MLVYFNVLLNKVAHIRLIHMKILHFLAAFCSIFLIGCTEGQNKMIISPEDNRIELIIPEAEEVRVYSTATTSENQIKDCFVIIFNNSGTYKDCEKINVANITRNGSAMQLLPQLSINISINDKVYVICNTGLSAIPSGINTENDLNLKFKPAKDYYFGGDALPMSGSFIWAPPSTSVVLIRTVAKVQVKLGESFNIGGLENVPEWKNFVINFDESKCGFIVGNYGGKSDIIAPLSNLSQNTSGLSGFYGATSENKFIRPLQYANSEDYMTMYINEYPNSTKDCEGNTIADNVFNEKRSFLLMVDQIDESTSTLGNGTKANAWRLDFYDPITKKYIDIKRNHHYTFVINKIRSMPYVYSGTHTVSNTFTGDQEVWHNPASNIEYIVMIQDDWATHNYSNGQYLLSLSADTIVDANTPLIIKAQVPAGIDASKISTHVIMTYDKNGMPIGQPGDNLEISGCTNRTAGVSFPTNGTTTTLTFKVNNFANLDSVSMYVYLGNIYKRIFISLKANIRVGTYNLRVNTANDKENAWPYRKEMVKSLVLRHGFDIFGAQEDSYIPHITDILEINKFAYVGVGSDDGIAGGAHNAIFYDKTRFVVLDKGHFWYSVNPDAPGLGWDAICCSRICSWAKFKDTTSDNEFYFFNSHFDHQGSVARLESSKLLLKKMKDIAGNSTIICTGDFNATPTSDPIKVLYNDGLLIDSRLVTKKPPFGTVGTTNGFNINAPMIDRIDYIFVTKDVTVKEYGVINDMENGRFPSDHFPVIAVASF